jgi:hypothetical protein
MPRYTFPTVYTEERPEGVYHAEDHGASTFGVFFKSRKMRRPRYIATAGNMEVIKARIEWYSKLG